MVCAMLLTPGAQINALLNGAGCHSAFDTMQMRYERPVRRSSYGFKSNTTAEEDWSAREYGHAHVLDQCHGRGLCEHGSARALLGIDAHHPDDGSRVEAGVDRTGLGRGVFLAG